MVSTVSVGKQTIRAQTLQHISALSKTYRHQADIRIQKTILSLPQYIQSKVICYYVSTKNEVDTIQLIKKELASQQKRVIVPKIDAHNLDLYEITSWNDLHTGTYGIKEPHNLFKRIGPKDVNLFIVPGIVFGQDGSRIGHGKGYYDRLLQNVNVPIIGLAYDIQMYPTVPHGARDAKLDIIITETHTYDFNVTPFRSKNI